MEKSIQQLKETLIKENKMYSDILKLAEQKTEVIIKGDTKALEDITKKEKQFIISMNTFEKIRRSILTNIANRLRDAKADYTTPETKHITKETGHGIVDEDFTISELLLFIEGDMGNDIDELRYELLKTINALKKVNKRNEKLIYQNLEYVNFNLEILKHLSEDGNKYNNKASESKGTKPINFFDAKV